VKDYLKTLVNPILLDAFDPKKLLLQLITGKVEALGIILTDGQKRAIEAQLQQNRTESIKLDISDDQLRALKVDLESTKTLSLDLDEIELPDIKERYRKAFDGIISVCQTEVADLLVQEWTTQSFEILAAEKNDLQNFNTEVGSVWGKAIDSLQMLLGITNTNCSEFSNELRSNASPENSHTIEAITRLHARGRQVTFEILTLLKSGCADGAHARWRTLHEIAVIANFLRESGNDIADRYLQHVGIETYRAAETYQNHCDTLKYEPISEVEFAALKSNRKNLIAQFGEKFGDDYGWATPIIVKKKKERITFADIEKRVKLEHIRPAYQMANSNVHAGAKGIAYRLGVPAYVDELIDGPSIYGLDEPGKDAAFSLNLLTSALLIIHPTLDNIAFLNALHALAEETYKAFDDAAAKVWATQ
jgi:Family of unknown function (DUF5677)